MKTSPKSNQYIDAVQHVIERERIKLQGLIPRDYEMSALLRMSYFETTPEAKRVHTYVSVCDTAGEKLAGLIHEQHRDCLKRAADRFTHDQWSSMAIA